MRKTKRITLKIAKYVEILKVSFMAASAYSKELYGTLGFLIITLFILFFLWKTIFSFETGDFEGFTLQKMIWYVAATEAIMLSSSRIRLRIDEEIRSGNVSNFLVKPFSYPLFLAFDSLGSSIFRFIVRMPVAFALALIFTLKFEISLLGLMSYIILGIMGLFLDALVTILIGLLAFYVEDTAPIYWIYNKLLFTIGGLLIPIDMMPAFVKTISKFFPARFILYNPANSLINFSWEFFMESFSYIVLFTAIVLLLTSLLFSSASRRLSINGG